MIFDVEQVFDEVGDRNEYFVIWVEDGFEDDVESTSCADGQDDMIRGDIESRGSGVAACYRFTRFGEAGVGHVSVLSGGGVGSDRKESVFERLGGLYDRIPKREVDDSIWASLSAKTFALLEHLADEGSSIQNILDSGSDFFLSGHACVYEFSL
jgi:hypothetical protein